MRRGRRASGKFEASIVADDDFDPDKYFGSLLRSGQLQPPRTLGGRTKDSSRDSLRLYLPNAEWADLGGLPREKQAQVLIYRITGHLLYDVVEWQVMELCVGRRLQYVADKLFETRAADLIRGSKEDESATEIVRDYVKRLAKEAFHQVPYIESDDTEDDDEDALPNFECRLLDIARNVFWGSYRSESW